MTFPSGTPAKNNPTINDFALIADVADSNILKKSTLGQVVKGGISSVDSDEVSEGSSNLYMKTGERLKLQSVEFGAEVNQVNQVNGQQGNVQLTQDNIPDGSNFVQTENNYSSTDKTQLTSAVNHLTNFSNPHDTTKSQVGLGNVKNEEQLSTTAGNFSLLTEKSDIQQHLDDLFVIEDSDDSSEIKKITNKTDLIWKASLIQLRGPSINYYAFNFEGSTTYNIRSIVVFGNMLYLCNTEHQSSGSFSADLANGYWLPISGGGGGGGGNTLFSGQNAPVAPGTNAGDLFVNYNTGQLYFWDGSDWTLVPTGGGGGGGVEFAVVPTTGNRVTFSVGVGGDTISESTLAYNPTTDTFTFEGSNIVYENIDVTWEGSSTITYADDATISHTYESGFEESFAGEVTNNYGNYTENNTYDANTTVNNDGGTHNYSNTNQIYDNTSNVTYEGPINITQINQFLGSDSFTGDGTTDTRGPLPGRVAGSTVELFNETTGLPLVEGVDYTIDSVTGVITFTPVIPNGQIVNGTVVFEDSLPPVSYNPIIPTANGTGIYVLTQKPSLVFKNGLYMTEGVSGDYVWDAGLLEIQFNEPTDTFDFIIFL